MNNTSMLKKNYEFKYILNKGKYYGGNYIEIYIKRNCSTKNKLGIAISRKITNAVNRNKIKRLIRENYRYLENKMKNGYSFVILWNKKADIKKASFFNIQQDILKIFQKADIM